jgi:hypothetical protein
MARQSDLAKIIDTRSDEIAQKKNVVAVAIGKKWVDGKPTDEDAIIVLVEKKESKENLDEKDLIPDQIDGAITDVVGKVGKLKKFALTARKRPCPAGYSCGHYRITAGTLGAYFRDRDGKTVILSNNHVLANENKAKLGDPIWQPGRYDRGKGKDKIGKLKSYQQLVSENKRIYNPHLKKMVNYNLEDSAIALLDSDKLMKNAIYKIGPVKGWNTKPKVGLKVQKSGRTTAKTTGKIIGINATVYVHYDIGVLKFRNQILTHDMSRGGDSGSLLLDMNEKAVGLLFAGSNTVTVHNRIIYPRQLYGLKIWKPEETTAPTKPKPKRRPKKRKSRRRRKRKCSWQIYFVRRGRRVRRRRRWRCVWA